MESWSQEVPEECSALAAVASAGRGRLFLGVSTKGPGVVEELPMSPGH